MNNLNLNINKVIKRYNDLMFTLSREHSTINTSFSESTEGWNLRDMVAECDYVLSTYYESGCINAEMKEEDFKTWKSETEKLKRFIKVYELYTKDLKCAVKHCSKYDNERF